jgi:hypothetical protein
MDQWISTLEELLPRPFVVDEGARSALDHALGAGVSRVRHGWPWFTHPPLAVVPTRVERAGPD